MADEVAGRPHRRRQIGAEHSPCNDGPDGALLGSQGHSPLHACSCASPDLLAPPNSPRPARGASEWHSQVAHHAAAVLQAGMCPRSARSSIDSSAIPSVAPTTPAISALASPTQSFYAPALEEGVHHDFERGSRSSKLSSKHDLLAMSSDSLLIASDSSLSPTLLPPERQNRPASPLVEELRQAFDQAARHPEPIPPVDTPAMVIVAAGERERALAAPQGRLSLKGPGGKMVQAQVTSPRAAHDVERMRVLRIRAAATRRAAALEMGLGVSGQDFEDVYNRLHADATRREETMASQCPPRPPNGNGTNSNHFGWAPPRPKTVPTSDPPCWSPPCPLGYLHPHTVQLGLMRASSAK